MADVYRTEKYLRDLRKRLETLERTRTNSESEIDELHRIADSGIREAEALLREVPENKY